MAEPSPAAALHVVVAGGSGFVGRHLVADLLRAGHRVDVLTRDPQRAQRRLPHVDGSGSAATAIGYDRLPFVCDAVVNLAGANLFTRRWTTRYKALLQQSRIDTTQRLVAAWRGAKDRPAVLVSTSAVGYYGDHGATVIDEDTPPDPCDFLAQLCVQWEQAAGAAAALDIRVAILRLGIVLGRGGGALLAAQVPTQLFLGARLGSGQQYWPWVHVGDVSRMIAWTLANGSAAGAYNVTAPAPCTNTELCHELARVLHRPCLLRAPAAVLRLLLGEVARYVLASQRVVPARALREGFAFRFPQLREALADLYRVPNAVADR